MKKPRDAVIKQEIFPNDGGTSLPHYCPPPPPGSDRIKQFPKTPCRGRSSISEGRQIAKPEQKCQLAPTGVHVGEFEDGLFASHYEAFFLFDESASWTNPALTNASLATPLMMPNRAGPSFCPPYHRVTTTITFQRSIICIR